MLHAITQHPEVSEPAYIECLEKTLFGENRSPEEVFNACLFLFKEIETHLQMSATERSAYASFELRRLLRKGRQELDSLIEERIEGLEHAFCFG